MANTHVRVGGWRIALDRLPAAIEIFRTTRDKIEQLARRGQNELHVTAMGRDDVSTSLATEVNARHLDGAGSMVLAAQSFSDELKKTVAALEGVEKHYRRTEGNSKQNFSGG